MGFNKQLRELARRMLRVMYHNRGGGLAANQVGSKLRLIVMNARASAVNGPAFETVMVNPTLTSKSEKTALVDEGSLCLPGIWWKRERPVDIEVAFFDGLARPHHKKYSGLEAQIVLHCLELLDGELWVPRENGLENILTPKLPQPDCLHEWEHNGDTCFCNKCGKVSNG